MGILQKTGNFLGVSKFGQGLATAGRVLSGGVGKDIARQNQNTAQVNKVLYAARQEKDKVRRTKLLQLAKSMGDQGMEMSADKIDPGLNLSNREVLGSAANVALNVLTPGAFKGAKKAIVAKNAALGAGFGAAQGLEKNRSAKGVVGSATGGALIGGAIGGASVAARAFKSFTTQTTPKWLMDKAIKPTLDESRKALRYGQKSLGEELLQEGVKGSPEKLLRIADDKLTSLEDELQTVINNPALSEARITRERLAPYLKDVMEAKAGTPGLQGDVQRIKNVFDSIPESMTLPEANQMKRRIYDELRDISYKLDSKLSTKGKALKQIARGLKEEIENEVGGTVVKDINQKLSLYGRLENRIVDQMARDMRNNGFGLTDAILTTGGLASMNPLGILGSLSAVGIRKGIGSTTARTNVAQGLNKMQNVGTGKTSQVVKGVTKRAILNAPNLGSNPSKSPQSPQEESKASLNNTTSSIGTQAIKIPRSSRLAFVNNNPGNLKFAGQKGAVRGEKGFAKFSNPQQGYSALKNQIKLDADRGLTLTKFVSKFAPPTENNTKQYIQQIVKETGFPATTPINKIPIDVLAKAVARKESGTAIT